MFFVSFSPSIRTVVCLIKVKNINVLCVFFTAHGPDSLLWTDGVRRGRHTLILIRERERPRERAPHASESESESESERANERASRSARAPAQGFLSPCTGAQSEARGGGARERRPLSLSLAARREGARREATCLCAGRPCASCTANDSRSTCTSRCKSSQSFFMRSILASPDVLAILPSLSIRRNSASNVRRSLRRSCATVSVSGSTSMDAGRTSSTPFITNASRTPLRWSRRSCSYSRASTTSSGARTSAQTLGSADVG